MLMFLVKNLLLLFTLLHAVVVRRRIMRDEIMDEKDTDSQVQHKNQPELAIP